MPHFAFGVAVKGRQFAVQPTPFAVAVARAIFKRDDFVIRRRAHLREDDFELRVIFALDPIFRRELRQLARIYAEQVRQLAVDIDGLFGSEVVNRNEFRRDVGDFVNQPLGFAQGHFVALAFNRVTHRALQQVAIDVALDQIILRAGLHGLNGDLIVIRGGQYDNRYVGNEAVNAGESFESVAVRQGEVEQDNINFGN